ncbi:MAG TPA: RDD family protein [Pyrinomonadaceae bacterium]
MQCSSCRAVYSNGLSICPRCKTPASKPSIESETKITETEREVLQNPADALATNQAGEPSALAAQASSTLIEFPGVSRLSRPQWRKDLSERVREIQERRARDAEEEAQRRAEQPVAAESGVPQLGLVPQPDVPEVNPIVAAALKRLERARQPPPLPRQRAHARGSTAAATARVAEEQYETDINPVTAQAPAPVSAPPHPTKVEQPGIKTSETARERALSIVPVQPATKVIPTPTGKQQSKSVGSDTVEKEAPALPESKDTEAIPFEEFYDDRAPVVPRIAGSLMDMLVVAFASSPFAAIIELTNGNWADMRVTASMGGIVLIVMFLYLAASTSLAGRTWGMRLVSLRAVDADTGLPPTTKQAVGRALLYILSLATLGIGLLYALFDPEGRTAHDHFSGTAVVRD